MIFDYSLVALVAAGLLCYLLYALLCYSAWGLTLDRRPSRTPVHAQHRIVSTN
jgi:hypothetical protein